MFIGFMQYILLVLVLSVGCSSESYDHAHEADINVDLFVQYLNDPLWIERDAYDAGHNLMIPLHWAFAKDSNQLQKAFADHFDRMLEAYASGEIDLGTLNELQYLTLSSRYLALGDAGSDDGMRTKLADLVHERFVYYWQEKPAWQWARDSFEGGIKERILWKLEEKNPERSYYTMFFDQEFFVVGIAADLLTFHSKKGSEGCSVYRDAVLLFQRVMEQRLDTSKKGWVFQAGIYRDRPTYAHSGYLTPPGLDAPSIVAQNIQEDSSHAHRWPLWLLQLSGVTDVSDLQGRLRQQLLNVVIDHNVNIGVPVLKNFMCGHNGYYRWNYQTHEEGTGYGPYQLSGTFTLGWWSLLGGADLAGLYADLVQAYPLNQAQMDVYSDLSTKERHPLVADAHVNGLRQNIARMAADLADE